LSTFYEIWETKSGNLVATCDTEDDAKAWLQRGRDAFGDQWAESFIIGRVDCPVPKYEAKKA